MKTTLTRREVLAVGAAALVFRQSEARRARTQKGNDRSGGRKLLYYLR